MHVFVVTIINTEDHKPWRSTFVSVHGTRVKAADSIRQFFGASPHESEEYEDCVPDSYYVSLEEQSVST